MAPRLVEVEEDDQSVVEALAPHTPLGAERIGIGLGDRCALLARAARDAWLQLRVDDDLRARAVADGLDGRLGLRFGRG